jgi:hypothetical protein
VGVILLWVCVFPRPTGIQKSSQGGPIAAASAAESAMAGVIRDPQQNQAAGNLLQSRRLPGTHSFSSETAGAPWISLSCWFTARNL